MKIQREDPVVVVELDKGFMDPAGERGFENGYQPLIAGGTRFVVDLSGLDFLDSKRLATLVVFFKRVNAAGGAVAFCGLRPLVRETFTITKLDQILKIFNSRSDALQSLKS